MALNMIPLPAPALPHSANNDYDSTLAVYFVLMDYKVCRLYVSGMYIYIYRLICSFPMFCQSPMHAKTAQCYLSFLCFAFQIFFFFFSVIVFVVGFTTRYVFALVKGINTFLGVLCIRISLSLPVSLSVFLSIKQQHQKCHFQQ